MAWCLKWHAIFAYAWAALALFAMGRPDKPYFLMSNETGVWHCTMTLSTVDFPQLEGRIKPTDFRMDIWLRYRRLAPDQSLIKAVFFAEPLSNFKKTNLSQSKPESALLDIDVRLHASSPTLKRRSWALTAPLHFQLSPITPSALPMPSSTQVTIKALPLGSSHQYTITALGGGPGKTCDFHPLTLPRSRLFQDEPGDEVSSEITVRSMGQPPIHVAPSEGVVIGKPIWPVNTATTVMLDRHCQHYHMLGFTA